MNPADNTLDPATEDIEVVARRVRRRVLTMLIAVMAIPLICIASTFTAHRRTLEIADCLPPGITLDMPLSPDARHPTVADALHEARATVQNGVLIDHTNHPIAFERDTSDRSPTLTPTKKPPEDTSRMPYRVIKIKTAAKN